MPAELRDSLSYNNCAAAPGELGMRILRFMGSRWSNFNFRVREFEMSNCVVKFIFMGDRMEMINHFADTYIYIFFCTC